MLRGMRLTLGLAAVLTLATGGAHAQYFYPYGQGYGGYGFGGWGQTVQGSTAAGMGAFAQGAGQYNYQTSQANSINADTVMRWNSYVWSSQNALNQEHYVRMARKEARNTAAHEAIQKRISEAPNDTDIRDGDALNAILQQLTHPEFLGGSGLARSTAEVPARTIRNIPFRYAPAAVVITLDRFRNDVPPLLRSDAVKAEREAFKSALEPALAKVKAGQEVEPSEVDSIRSAGKALYAKVETGLPDATYAERKAALDYLNSLKAFLKMLANPDFAGTLRELEKIESTTVGHLIAFMHTYNLRFGPATTTGQLAAYATLYPVLAAERDRLLRAPGAGTMAPPPPGATATVPTDLFRGIDPKHLDDAPPGR